MTRKTMTQKSIATLTKPGFHRDPLTVGLYVQVTRSQKTGSVARSWAYRYRSPETKVERWMGLGPCDLISLAEARQLATENRRKVRIEKIDPIEEKRREELRQERERLGAMTFAECVDQYLAKKDDELSNAKHRKQWRTTLDTACAAFGKLDVRDVDTAMIVKLLAPIMERTPETGSRLRSRIEKVLDWATVTGLREGENPARWKEHLQHALPARKGTKKHHASMPFEELPTFMEVLRSRSSISAAALEFNILTAARSGETRGARWDEVDLQAKTWTVPAERIKGKVEHVVALCDRAVELLQGLDRTSSLIFPSQRGTPLSDMALTACLRKAGAGDYTVHGMRSTFSTWANERTKFSSQVIEFALAHQIKNPVERAYNRTNQLPQRIKLMNSWDNYLSRPHPSVSVVPFGVAS